MIRRHTYSIVCCLAVIMLWRFCYGVQPLYAQEPPVETPTAETTETTDAPTESENSAPAPEESTSITNGIEQSQPQIEWGITGGKVFWAIIIVGLGSLAIKFVTRVLTGIADRNVRRRLTINRAVPIVNIAGWTIVAYLLIAGIFAPPKETLIALGASLAIALGFAAQDILRNIFGGFMILLDHPFQVGDKITVGDHYGEVTQIGLRSIRITTPDDNSVTIPNGEAMNQPISNANSGESNAQVVSEFYLPLDVDLTEAKKIAYRAAAVSRYIYLNKPISIVFKNEIHEDKSLLKMRLKAYVLDVRYEFPFASEMTEIVVQEFLQAGLITPEHDDAAVISTTS